MPDINRYLKHENSRIATFFKDLSEREKRRRLHAYLELYPFIAHDFRLQQDDETEEFILEARYESWVKKLRQEGREVSISI